MTPRRDIDALAELLRYAAGQQDTQALSAALLERFGSLAGAMDAPYEALASVPGLTEHAALLLKLIPQFGRKMMTSPPKGSADTPERAAEILRPRFFGRTEETVFALFVDRKRRALDCRKVSRGAERFASVDARRLADIALGCGAMGLYLAHNHPRGRPEASPGDLAATRRLTEGLRGLDVEMLGHIIFADEEYALILPLADA
jgi:DNA repair protein RadC